MTNARTSRANHKRIEELVAERNALLDVLNGILLKGGGSLFVEHEFYLGQPRCVVEALPHPAGVMVKRNPDLAVTEHGSRLFIVPAEARA